MKKLMAQLKKGSAIGEIFNKQNNARNEEPMKVNNTSPDEYLKNADNQMLQSIKAQRLEDLKKQRQTLEVQESYHNMRNFSKDEPYEPSPARQSDSLNMSKLS